MRTLPFATELGPDAKHAWAESIRGHHQTRSERYLAQLARRSFLTLWNYTNVFTDEGRSAGKGDGKELCDLLVVFGRHVLLFSDKDCEYKPHTDPKVAWRRWYKRSIENSARQLVGAKSWVQRFPQRIYLDRQCRHPLPVQLPPDGLFQFHLIAVVRGAAASAVEHWKSVAKELSEYATLIDAPISPSSGSLMLSTKLEGRQHYDHPFQVGWPLNRRTYVHVFDEESLDVVLGVLDTLPDFVRYLERKEEFLSWPDRIVVAPGEEDLLATYLLSTKSGEPEPSFRRFAQGEVVVLREGDWRALKRDKSFRARQKANRVSYLWDELIEFQTSHLVAGSSYTIGGDRPMAPEELVLRKMAEEPRITRRALGAAVDRARRACKTGQRYTRTVLRAGTPRRAYVVMALGRPKDMPYEEYLEHRRYQLSVYCEGCAAQVGAIEEVVGIAVEPFASKTASVDFISITLTDRQKWLQALPEVRDTLRTEGMWDHRSLKTSRVVEHELPDVQQRKKAIADAAAELFRRMKRSGDR